MPLLAAQKLGKINLKANNQRVTFSHPDIWDMCGNTHAQSAVRKIIYISKTFVMKDSEFLLRTTGEPAPTFYAPRYLF